MRTNQNSLADYRQHYQPRPTNRASAHRQRWRNAAFYALLILGMAACYSGLLMFAVGGAEMHYPQGGVDPLFAALSGVSLLINGGILLIAAVRMDSTQ